MNRRKINKRTNRGFSLIELLLVLVILGVLAAIVVPKLSGQSEKARITATRTQISNLRGALMQFELEMGRFPSSSEGLDALVNQPSGAEKWDGPYLENRSTVPQDPWGNDYVYAYPGSRNEKSYDLYSTGPDGNEGTEDDVYATDDEKNS